MRKEIIQKPDDQIVQQLKPIELLPLPEKPLVSVVIANYNYGQYIGEAIESVLNQIYQNFEIIICDDGSTDNSLEIIEDYANRDSRVRYIVKENGGVASALNVTFSQSKGEVICLLDADDVFLPEKIYRTISASMQDEKAGVFVHKVLPVDYSKRPINEPLPKVIDHGWIGPVVLRNGGRASLPPASGVSLRREIANLLFPVPLLRRRVDAYITGCALLITRIVATSDTLALYRLHGHNITGTLHVSASSIERGIEACVSVADATRDFLNSFYGPQIAKLLSIGDSSEYWEHLLASRILKRAMNKNSLADRSDADILKRLPNGKRKIFWLILSILPPPLAWTVLEKWWGDSTLKRIFKGLRYRSIAVNKNG